MSRLLTRSGALAAFALLLIAGTAPAAPISLTLSQSTGSGDAILISVGLDDTVVAGQIKVTLNVVDNPAIAGAGIGDLRAFYFHTTPDTAAFLSGLNFTGADITDSAVGTNSIDDLGGGTSVNPLGPFDAGVEIGTSGIGGDDFQTTSFFISHDTLSLDNTIFPILTNFLAVRATSVGTVGGSRDDSGKYGNITFGPGNGNGNNNGNTNGGPVIPEPATMVVWGLLGLGGAGVGLLRRRRKAVAN